MRILQLTSSLSARIGGPTMVINGLAVAQAAMGHSVTLCAYETPAGEQEMPVEMELAKGNLRLSRIPLGGRLERVYPRRGMRHVRRLLAETDVLHLHCLWDPICLGAAIEARRAGVPYVLAPHGMLDPWSLSEKALKKKFFLALAFGKMVRRAALIHAVSDYEVECVRSLGYRMPIATIPNGLFLEKIDPLPAPGTFYSAHPELKGEPFVLFLSRLHPVKGLDILVSAFASVLGKCPRARLVVVGPDWGAKAGVVEQIERLGIRERVHFIGALYGKEKFAAMVDAACFALPSKHEVFGVVIIEAFAAGCPAVFSEHCYFPDASDTSVGYCVKREPSAFAGPLERLLSDPALRSAMGRAGRRLVEERYTWQRVAALSIEAYREILSSHQRRLP